MPREFAAFIRNDIETWVYGSGIVGLSEVMAVQQFSITDGRRPVRWKARTGITRTHVDLLLTQ
jgi:hypothetical protein